MNHTERFNQIMKRVSDESSVKKAQKKEVLTPIKATDNMNTLQTDLSKCHLKGNVLILPEEPLQNYTELRKALLNAGANYKRNTFVFSSDAKPFIDRLMSGDSINIKKEFQAFFTPPDIADWMAQHLFITNDDTVMEPSCGEGRLIHALRREGYFNEVLAYELNPIYSKIAASINGVKILGEDFLTHKPDHWGQVDRIIANPPFNKNQDVKHIYKMWECLKPGGRIVTVASKHSQFANDKISKSFREFLELHEAESYDLESGAFKSSGTLVSSQILIIDKPKIK